MPQITRNTENTRRAQANMIKLVRGLEARPMTTGEMAAFMGMSRSGCHKYFQKLAEVSLISRLRVPTPGKTRSETDFTYHISGKPSAVTAFLASLNFVQSEQAKARQERRRGIPAGRNIHIDPDMPMRVPHVKVPQMDALTAALFGRVAPC